MSQGRWYWHAVGEKFQRIFVGHHAGLTQLNHPPHHVRELWCHYPLCPPAQPCGRAASIEPLVHLALLKPVWQAAMSHATG